MQWFINIFYHQDTSVECTISLQAAAQNLLLQMLFHHKRVSNSIITYYFSTVMVWAYSPGPDGCLNILLWVKITQIPCQFGLAIVEWELTATECCREKRPIPSAGVCTSLSRPCPESGWSREWRETYLSSKQANIKAELVLRPCCGAGLWRATSHLSQAPLPPSEP